MPRNPIDYSKTIMYKIVCNDLSIKNVYVGHTTDEKSRKREHKSCCNNPNSSYCHLKVYRIILKRTNYEEISKYKSKMEEQISKIEKKIEDIETILETYSAESWDEHRRGKVGAFYVYSLDELKEEKKQLREEKKQLREEKNLLLAQKASPAGKFTFSSMLSTIFSISLFWFLL